MKHVDRYSRQVRFGPIGPQGQERLSRASVLVCGCGALGTVVAERLVRAGIGTIRIVDRDWVEWSNLQRQSLFTEQDALDSVPKAVAAASALEQINSSIHLEAMVEDVTYANLPRLAAGCDLIVDGTDNFETRFLINDFSIRHNVPWVHGGCLGASGQAMAIIPGKTACFRCLLPELPPSAATETCDSAGVLGPAIGVIANWQAALALKILASATSDLASQLIVVDTWSVASRIVDLPISADCPCCQRREFPFLEGKIRSDVTVLCGKNAVQIQLPKSPLSRGMELASRLQNVGEVSSNPFFVRVKIASHTLTIFPDGRTVVEGTSSPAEARSILSRTIGL